jgi:hypothetical protein
MLEPFRRTRKYRTCLDLHCHFLEEEERLKQHRLETPSPAFYHMFCNDSTDDEQERETNGLGCPSYNRVPDSLAGNIVGGCTAVNLLSTSSLV